MTAAATRGPDDLDLTVHTGEDHGFLGPNIAALASDVELLLLGAALMNPDLLSRLERRSRHRNPP